MKLPYLPTSADVIAGDLLVTSGLGGGFPAGYPVGTVAEVKRDPAQSLADVDVKPAAALDRSRELMFVWLKSKTPAAPAPSAQASRRKRPRRRNATASGAGTDQPPAQAQSVKIRRPPERTTNDARQSHPPHAHGPIGAGGLGAGGRAAAVGD